MNLTGINQTRDVKIHLKEQVRELFKDQIVQQKSWNSSYYTSDKDITNHIHLSAQKVKLDKMDQVNLQKYIDIWKIRPFAGFAGGDDKSNDDKKSVKSEDTNDQKLLFVHQEKWQRNLLKKYGTDLCLMDATYKTTKYALPLFLVAVKTNSGYSIVGKNYFYDITSDI